MATALPIAPASAKSPSSTEAVAGTPTPTQQAPKDKRVPKDGLRSTTRPENAPRPNASNTTNLDHPKTGADTSSSTLTTFSSASIIPAEAGWADVLVLNPDTDPDPLAKGCSYGYASGTGFKGTPENLQETIDLRAYANKRVQFRFYFDTRDGNYQAHDGWSIDNVNVLGAKNNTIFSTKAEDAVQPWTVTNSSGTAPGWQITGSDTAKTWRYFNPALDTYQKSSANACSDDAATFGALTSPEITLDSSSTLKFDTIWEIESVNPSTYDLMRVQITLAKADLTTSVQGPTYVPPSGTANYTVTVANAGGMTATGTSVSGGLSSGAITTAVANNGATCDIGAAGATFGCSGGTSDLLGGQSMQVSIAATAPATTGAMTLSATASTTATESSTTNNTASASTYVVKGIIGTVLCPPPTIGKGWQVDLFSGGTFVAETVSDDVTGQYLFVDVGAGTFEVRASKNGVTCTTSVTVADGVGVAGDTVQVLDLLNHSWRTAYTLGAPTVSSTGIPFTPITKYINNVPFVAFAAKVQEHLYKPHQSLWFKVPVHVGDKMKFLVTGCTFNCDMILYRNPSVALGRPIGSVNDLQKISIEMAPEDFSPEDFSPEDFSPEDFSPEDFSPEDFSPEDFSPEDFSPEDFSPEDFSPEDFSPEDFSPEDFSADQASPNEIVPTDANTNALRRSLMAMSLREGTANEYLVGRIWSPIDYVYVRIRARNGESSAISPIQLNVVDIPGSCAGVSSISVGATPAALIAPTTAPSVVKTVVITDQSLLPLSTAQKNTLAAFVGRPEVSGVALDVSTAARVSAAKTQAGLNVQCPFAKNLIAAEIKAIIDGYPRPTATTAGLQYVVLVGGDAVIPFFREIDTGAIAGERLWGGPPYDDDTASQAAIRRGYVLSQLRYGAVAELAVKDRSVPVADVAVGRLVETASEVTGMLQAYLDIPSGTGTYPVTTSPLVTGYGNMLDGSQAIQAELEAGTGKAADTLYHAGGPNDPGAWTADDLRAKLFGTRHDLTFLAWHASQAAGLAADYKTRLPCSEIAASGVDMKNTVTFAQACHYGTNAPDADLLSVSPRPDCPQSYAQKKATLITGTAFQYFDTDIVDFGERAYREFAHQLRDPAQPSIGQALTRALTVYIANSPLGGTHEKQYLETTLYGLPQLKLTLGGTTSTPDPSVVTTGTTTTVLDPGNVTVSGLRGFDLNRPLTLTPNSAAGGRSYLSSEDGTYGEALQPVLPYDTVNVTFNDDRVAGFTGYALRGAVLLEGDFTDSAVTPLIKSPASELSTDQVSFTSEVAYPVLPFRLNYIEALVGTTPTTRVGFTPAQHWTTATQTQRRAFTRERLSLFYSNVTGAGAADGAPAITETRATADSATAASFSVHVTSGAPGIKVWITYYTVGGTALRSFELTRDATDTSLWTASHDFTPTTLANVRFIVQAVNAVGVVGRDTNNGAYYVPAAPEPTLFDPRQTTAVSITTNPGTGTYGQTVAVAATLTSGGAPLPGQLLTFRIGGDRVDATTNGSGLASVSMRLRSKPGSYTLVVSFNQTADLLASSARALFTINKAGANLSLTLATRRSSDALTVARLTSSTGAALDQRSVVFAADAVGGFGSTTHLETLDQTNFNGEARLYAGALQPDIYNVTARFGVPVTIAGDSVDLTDRFYTGVTTTGQVAVFDPLRSVAAAGQMNVPPTCPTVDGMCSIGFRPGDRAKVALNAAYLPGANTPSGGVVFQVPSTNFNLSGSQIDWVVVAGKRAVIQGSATVNGETGWRYRIIVVDLVTGTKSDSFEIRIWNPSHTTHNSVSDPQYKMAVLTAPSTVDIR